CATERVEVMVRATRGEVRAEEAETVGHGHARRLTDVLARALEHAAVAPRQLEWVAADLGPGSFTGVRVGLATAEALALASGARLFGASSLASLAHGAPRKRALIAPMVPAGRSGSAVGFVRADGRSPARIVAAPRVVGQEAAIAAVHEARRAAGMAQVACIGPAVPRWGDALEQAFPRSTVGGWRHDGLKAMDLADA